MQSSYIAIFIIIFVLLIERRNNTVLLQRLIRKKKTEGNTEMLELAKRFIGKECLIYTFNAQMDGTVREVSEGAILLDRKGTLEAVNLDYIVRIREYPRAKSGKKKSVILD